MKSEVRGQILSGCAVRAALQQGPSLRDALRTIYEDIPARPNMTEAGRVAMMAETARAALESDSHETYDGHTREVRTSNDRPVPPLYGGKVRLACGCIDICTNQRDHLGWSKPPSEKAEVQRPQSIHEPCRHGVILAYANCKDCHDEGLRAAMSECEQQRSK